MVRHVRILYGISYLFNLVTFLISEHFACSVLFSIASIGPLAACPIASARPLLVAAVAHVHFLCCVHHLSRCTSQPPKVQKSKAAKLLAAQSSSKSKNKNKKVRNHLIPPDLPHWPQLRRVPL